MNCNTRALICFKLNAFIIAGIAVTRLVLLLLTRVHKETLAGTGSAGRGTQASLLMTTLTSLSCALTFAAVETATLAQALLLLPLRGVLVPEQACERACARIPKCAV